jgi:hypothetical protein
VHLDDHTAGRWRRFGDRPDTDRTTEFIEDHCVHQVIVSAVQYSGRSVPECREHRQLVEVVPPSDERIYVVSTRTGESCDVLT